MTGGRHPHPEALYYHTAGDTLEAAKAESDPFKKTELVSTCMVFSALCLEAYINQEFHTFAEKLAAEMLDALNNEGGAIQKKLTAHRQAEANRFHSKL